MHNNINIGDSVVEINNKLNQGKRMTVSSISEEYLGLNFINEEGIVYKTIEVKISDYQFLVC